MTRSGQVTIDHVRARSALPRLVQDYTYDPGTGRPLQTITNLQTLPSAADTTSYTYDPAGNLTSESDAQNTGATQTQCFSQNGLDQLTAAWTDTGGTQTAAPPVGWRHRPLHQHQPLGGQYRRDQPRTGRPTLTTCSATGPRRPRTTPSSWTVRGTPPRILDHPGRSSTQAGNLTKLPVLLSNAPATAQPGSLTRLPASSRPARPSTPPTTTPAYNADGQLTSQPVTKTTGTAPTAATPPALSQVTYTPQGQVATVTTSSGTTSYLYDASGTLLIQTDPSGTILYADGGAEEITLTGTTLSGLRLLSAPGGVTVTESSSGTRHLRTGEPAGNRQRRHRGCHPGHHPPVLRPLGRPSRHASRLARPQRLPRQAARSQHQPGRPWRPRLRPRHRILQPHSTRSWKPAAPSRWAATPTPPTTPSTRATRPARTPSPRRSSATSRRIRRQRTTRPWPPSTRSATAATAAATAGAVTVTARPTPRTCRQPARSRRPLATSSAQRRTARSS